MSDAAKMLLQAARDVAFHHLHVVNVVLDKEVVRPDIADELSRLLGAAEEETRDVDRVDRLDQQPELLAQHRLFKIIGEEIFDAAKTCGLGRGKAIDERHLREQHSKVGGKLWHGRYPLVSVMLRPAAARAGRRARHQAASRGSPRTRR